MVKYEIKTLPKSNKWILNYKHKTVSKSELDRYLKQGWTLVRKKYFIITPFLDLWRPISVENRISLIRALIPVALAIVFGLLIHRSYTENEVLITEKNALKAKVQSLEKTNTVLTDSIHRQNIIIDSLSKIHDSTL